VKSESVKGQKVAKTETAEFPNKSNRCGIPFCFNMESVAATVKTFLRRIQFIRVSRVPSEWGTFSRAGHVFADICSSFPFQINAFTAAFLSKDVGVAFPRADGRKVWSE
jgi:hypothetical protein